MDITIQLPGWAIFVTQDRNSRVDVWSHDPAPNETYSAFLNENSDSRCIHEGLIDVPNWGESKVDLRTHDAFINDKGILCKVERSTELPSMLKPQHDL